MWRGTYALTLRCSVRWIIFANILQNTFSPCLPSKLFHFFSPQPIVPFPFPASHLIFWIVWVQKQQVLGNSYSALSVLLFLIKLPWSACQVLKSCRSVSAKEAASFGRTDITALVCVSWPAAGFLLPSVCCIAKLTICGPKWAAQIFGKLGIGRYLEWAASLPATSCALLCCQSKLLLNSTSVLLLLLVIIFLPELGGVVLKDWWYEL